MRNEEINEKTDERVVRVDNKNSKILITTICRAINVDQSIKD